MSDNWALVNSNFYAEINAVFFSIAVLFLILRYALFQGYVQLAGTILIIATWGGMTYLAWIGDGARDLAMIVYIFLGLLFKNSLFP